VLTDDSPHKNLQSPCSVRSDVLTLRHTIQYFTHGSPARERGADPPLNEYLEHSQLPPESNVVQIMKEESVQIANWRRVVERVQRERNECEHKLLRVHIELCQGAQQIDHNVD
jgi:hypothetical protein